VFYKRFNLSLIALLCTFGARVPAYASPFQNGSFETPVLAGFDFTLIPPGWTKFDTSCGSDNCSGNGLFLENYGALALPALTGGGSQAFGFGGNGNFGSTLRQTFDTIAGHPYQVSFYYVIQQGTGFEDWTLDALDGINGLATKSQRFNNTAWAQGTLQFNAASTQSTLRFTDGSGVESFADHASTNWALDLVTVTDLGASTPEPAGIILTSVGLVFLGVVRKITLSLRLGAEEWPRRSHNGPPALS